MKAHPNWGRLGSFACTGCKQEVSTFGGVVSPAGLVGVAMAVCRPCATRMDRQPQFRSAVTAKAGAIAALSLVQRIADALGLDAQAVHIALASTNGAVRLGDTRLDDALGLTPGRFDAALAFVVEGAKA